MKNTILALLFLFSFQAYSQTLENDRLALIALYNSTNGANWTNKTGWVVPGTLGDDPCGWFGVNCFGGRVNNLNLYYNNLSGTIPIEIGNLTNLTSLSLTRNQITGTIPMEIGNLTQLTSLSLGENQLTGSIPSFIGNLDKINSLYFGFNQLSGTIPPLTLIPINALVSINNNSFTFSGMENNINKLDNYGNQIILQIINNSGVLSVDAGGTLTNNTYKWFKGGQLLDTKVGDNTYTPTIGGYYYVEVTNSIISSLTLYGTSIYANDPLLEQDRLALIALYNSTNGSSWTNKTNWVVPGTTGDNPCGWFGVYCFGGRVNNLNLPNNNLSGTIPPEIGNLSSVQSISLFGNQIVGTFPPQIENLINLKSIDIGNNGLSGVIPLELTNLINLNSLGLYNNKLSGNIPPEIGNLTMLSQINLSDNQLTGIIPNEIENLLELQGIALNNNQLSGNLPPAIGNLPKLGNISLSNNQFTGNIPASFGNLDKITYLVLSDNKLTGTIPPLTSIKASALLLIYGNQFNFSGIESNIDKLDYYSPQANIPIINNSGVLSVDAGGTLANNTFKWYKNGQLAATNTGNNSFTTTGAGTYIVQITNSIATALTLNSIHITITGPLLEQDRLALIALYNSTNGANWTNKTNWVVPGTPGDNPCGWFGVSCTGGRVYYLSLGANNLVGQLPLEIGLLDQLQVIILTSNTISGNIPLEIGNLNKLFYLNLSRNNLSGAIPVNISNLTKLEWLTLGENKLSGTISTDLNNLTKIKRLDLNDNLFTGNIPSNIGELILLEHLYLGGNVLTGNIPPELGSLINLQFLTLNNNHLEGGIPNTFNGLTNLKSLALFNNNLSGEIPINFGQLSNLENLMLWKNNLSGSIPAELGNIQSIKYINLNNNNLSGTIPLELGNLTNLENLDLSFNNLNGTIPAGLVQNTKFKYLYLNNNKLSGVIPSLTSIPIGATVILYNNNFNFAGIESNITKIDYYSPQANIPITNTNGVLSVEAGGTLANNTFKWYKNGQLATTNTGNNSFITTGAGNYWVQITNSIATALTLNSIQITITDPLLEQDRLALIALYNSTNGANWTNKTNWLVPGNTGDNPCNGWYGVGCSGGRVTDLILPSNNLAGSLTTEIGKLTMLRYLNLEWNQISGSIPAELGDLDKINELNLSYNKLSGTIPSLISIPTSATVSISGNYFTFSGMENNIDKLDNYGGQATSLPITNTNGVLSVEAGGTLSNNTYNWYKEGQLIATIAGNNNFTPLSAGNYLVQVKNSIAIFLTLFSTSMALTGPLLEQDRLALVALYNATNGDSWKNKTNWVVPGVSGDNPCGWYGVGCDNGRVITINLTANNLVGTIPIEIGNLKELTFIILSENSLTGSIPNQIGNLTELNSITLNDNLLTGSIPDIFDNLTKLGFVDLRSNNLTGNIPNSLANRRSLSGVSLSFNNLNGDIPLFSGINGSVSLNDNSFTFSGIESNIAKLNHYSPQDNIPITYTNGVLSVDAGGTIANNTYNWYKDGNLIATNTGNKYYITTSNGNYHVQVTNSIATALTLNSNTYLVNQPLENDAQNLAVIYNQNNGTGWPQQGGWEDAGTPGDDPCTLYGIGCNNGRITSIDLSNNDLTGTIPIEIGALEELTSLNLSFNELTGSIPSDLFAGTNLRIASNQSNTAGEANRGGRKSATLGLSNLVYFSVSNNQLSGAIPDLTNLSVSATVDISNNNFTFDGMEANISKLDLYSPQAKIPVTKNVNKLSVNAGGTLSNNTYKWYKDNVFLTTIVGNPELTISEMGTYRVEVTNAVVTGLTLVSEDYIQNNPLPVTLISFTGQSTPNGSELKWITTFEKQNQGFDIERSVDGRLFEKIGTVDGKGESAEKRNYVFLDKAPLTQNYYRLKQMDFDETFTYSKIIFLKNENRLFSIYPNPAKQFIKIESSSTATKYQLFDQSGRMVQEKPFVNKEAIPTSHLKPGLYIIKLGEYSRKLMIE